MFRYITFLFLFFSFCQQAKGQFLNYSIKEGLPVAVLPFELYNDFIVVSLVYENRLPLRFILDTGATHTLLIHKEYADITGTKFERRIFIRGADRKQLIPALVTESVELDISKIVAKNQHILVLEENLIALDKYAGLPIDGILGLDIFKKFIVKIDYITEKLIFYKPDHFKPQLDKYEVLDLNMNHDKLYLKSPIEIKKDSITEGSLSFTSRMAYSPRRTDSTICNRYRFAICSI
ncbi:MAG: retropepsin-like aspartic protease [Saprospiraceae bacterium]